MKGARSLQVSVLLILAGLVVLAVFLLVETGEPRSSAGIIARLPAPTSVPAATAPALLLEPRPAARAIEEAPAEPARESLAAAPREATVTGSVRTARGGAGPGADVRLVPLLLIDEPAGVERLTRADAQGSLLVFRLVRGGSMLGRVLSGADLRGVAGADVQAELPSPIDGSWVAHGPRDDRRSFLP